MTQEADFEWVAAAPFAAHTRHVMATTGLPWRVVARLADVPAPTMRALVSGRKRRLPVTMARRLFEFDVAAAAGLRHRLVPAERAAACVLQLRGGGFSWRRIAEFLEVSEFEARQLARGSGSCTALMAARAEAAAEAHGLWHPESRGEAA